MITFRPASRSEIKPLIGLYSESGCGKTYSSLLLARGFVGPAGKVGMIDTESGRGEAYADIIPGGYIVCPMREPFSPRAYGEAITAAEQAALDVLIIDSASHEWEGAGGVLSMAAENQASGKKGPLVWQMPKLEHHRQFMLRLLATPIPLVIVCMRAKYPMRELKNERGIKEWVRSETLEPKQADDILFEMFVHGWIDQAHNFHGTKYTRQDLREIIKDGEPISIKTGEALADWAKGGDAPATPSQANAERVLRARVPMRDVPGAPVEAGGRASGEPTRDEGAEQDRAVLKARITGAADKLGIPKAERTALAKFLLGGETIDTADISAVHSLLDAVRAWRPER